MSASAPPAKTQRRGDETKRRLIEATKKLLADYDYQTVTLDQISTAVGVAKSSILWHFDSKEGLLTEAVFQLFEEVDQKITLEKANLNTLDERIEYMLQAVAKYFTANPAAKGITITLVFNSQVPAEIHKRIREQWEQHIAEIQSFLSSDDVQVSETTASAIMALMHGCYVQWYLRGRKNDLRKKLPEAFAALGSEVGQLMATSDKQNRKRES